MGWLRVLDIPFDILASLLYRSTRHFLLGGTNMPPRAPRGATVAKTHGLPTRTITHSSDCGIHGAGPHGSYGETDGSWAEIAAFGSSAAAALELLGHAMLDRIEVKCCTSFWTFSVSQSGCPAARTR